MPRIEKQKRNRTIKNNAIKNITKWKSNIMQKLIEDDELAKLLVYNSPDCLSKPSVTDDVRESLVNKQIFGYRYIPEVAQETKSYISMSTSNFVPQEGYRQFSDDYLMGFIFFYILVDSAVIETETGYRQDLIAARVYEIFQEREGLGIGKTRMESFVENWEQNNKFGGYTIGFRTVDFK